MVACRGRDTGPQPNHSILLSHGRAGLMAACRGRDTGPRPNHSILPSHGSGGLMAACCADIQELLVNLTTCVVKERCHFWLYGSLLYRYNVAISSVSGTSGDMILQHCICEAVIHPARNDIFP